MIKLDKIYFGIVEDVNDPLFFGRLRVRIFGVHNEDKSAVPTDKLPWCDVGMPMPHPFISGIGLSPTGMVNGSMVLLIPKDPDLLQEWFVLFSVGGMRKKYKNGTVGFNDPEGYYPRSNTNHDVNVVVRGKNGAAVDIPSEGGEMPKGMGAAADKAANRTKSEVDKPIDKGEDPSPETPTDYKDAPWMKFAEQNLGVNEKDHPAKIKEFHAQGGGSSSWGGETPWCASFVGWCLKQAGKKGSGSAMARSYSNYGKEVTSKPIPYGAIIVVAGSRGPSSGHVCFATGESGDRVQVIGGNQSNKSYDNGGEVTRSSFPKSKILAVRWPN